jgi:hypothetical protein
VVRTTITFVPIVLILALSLLIGPTLASDGDRATVTFEDGTTGDATTGDPFTFSVNVTGDSGVQDVWVEYWYGDNRSEGDNLTMTAVDISPQGYGNYNLTITIRLDTDDDLNYTFYAADGNGDLHPSPRFQAIVVDTKIPTVQDLSDRVASTGETFHFECLASDNVGIVKVYVIYRFGATGGGPTPEMNNTGGGGYEWDLDIPSDMNSPLIYHIQAVDATGNWGITPQVIINVTDIIEPTIISDLTNTTIVKGLSHTFAVEVSDNIGIRSVHITYWIGLGSRTTIEMSGDGTTFSVDVDMPRHPPSGDLYYQFEVVDMGDNLVEKVFSQTLENVPPSISSIPTWQLVEKESSTLDLTPYISDPNDVLEDLSITCDFPPVDPTDEGLGLVSDYPDYWTRHEVTFTVSDGEDSVNGSVWVEMTKVPVITSTPSLSGKVNETYTYQVTWELDSPTAVPQLKLLVRPAGMSVGTNGRITWTPTKDQHDVHDVEVELTYNGMITRQRWSITVDPETPHSNNPPFFIGEPLKNAIPGELYEWDVQAADPDGDKLYFHLLQGPEGATMVNSTGHLEWMPPYPRENMTNYVTFQVEVTDGIDRPNIIFVVRVRYPADQPPEILGNIPDVATDTRYTRDLIKYMSDPDDDTDNLTWRVEGADDELFTAMVVDNELVITPVDGARGNTNIKLVLIDPSGLTDDTTITVEVYPPPFYTQQWFLLLLLVIIAVSIIAVMAVRRSQARAAMVAVKARAPAEIVVDGEAGEAAAAPVVEERPMLPYITEQIFVVYNDGRLITEAAREECRTQDADLMSGMLIAIQGLIQDGLQSGGTLESIKYGENLIMMTKGEHLILAAVIYGKPDEDLRGDIEALVRKIEGNHAGVIEDWSGDPEVFSRMHQMITPLLYNTTHLTREDIEEVSMSEELALLSAVDFFQGYVRLKVAAVNTTREAIMDTSLEVYYNSDLLRLERIEPESLKLRGDRVIIGNIKPRERSTVAFLFDPQICQESHIDGTLAYFDTTGELKHISMKRRMADVVCPIFFTRENANTAMLRRLIKDELHLSDMRVFRYPKVMAPQQVLQMGMTSIGGDIQKVSEYIVDRPKFEAEVWYYGETKVKKQQMVMRLSVIQDKGVVEYFVASTAMEPITGMLAEFRRELDRRLEAKMPAEGKMSEERDEGVRRELEERELMLDRFEDAAEEEVVELEVPED